MESLRVPAVLFVALTFGLLATLPAHATLSPEADLDAPARATEAREPLVAPSASDAAARTTVANLPRATQINDQDGDKIFDTLEHRFLNAIAQTGDPKTTVPAIVVFRSDVATHDGLAMVHDTVAGVDVRHTYTIIPGFSAHLEQSQAVAIATLDEVRQVQWSPPGTLELETARHFSGVDAVTADYGYNGDRDGDARNFTSADVTILISDTGFDSKHADLPPAKFLAFLDEGENVTDEPYESGSHGTHVASIAAGLGVAEAKHRGVAPGAALIGSKITGACTGPSILGIVALGGSCPDAHELAIATLDWAVANKATYGIDISTISFGFGRATDGTDALELAMDKAWDAGIVNFKSTGNSGPNPGTITVPAAARGIIATAALSDPQGAPHEPLQAFSLASFSSRGPTTDGRIKPDIAAPGVAIMAAEAGTTDGYVAFSGTSMASPFAAGTAALVLDANPDLTPDEVRDVLFRSARDWGAEGPDSEYGNGRLDAMRAVEYAAYLRDATFQASAQEPNVPFHQTLDITLDMMGSGSDTFHVEDASIPLSATLIALTTPDPDRPWMVNAQIVGPEGQRTDVDHVATLGRTPSRQVTLQIMPTGAGEHELQIVGQGGSRIIVDVSAGVPAPELAELVPEPGFGIEGGDVPAETPGPGIGLLLFALLGLAGRFGATRVRREP